MKRNLLTVRFFRKNLRLLKNIIIERIQGLDFSCFEESASSTLDTESFYPYECTPSQLLHKVFDRLHLRADDKLLDVGCGKGYAIYFLRRHYPFACVDGVEISSRLVDIAKANMRRLKIRANIFLSDAAHFTELDEYNYFYLSNPFPENAMSKFIKNLMHSYLRNSREITLIYTNPTCHQLLVPYAKQLRAYEDKIDRFRCQVFIYNLNFDHGN